MCQNAHAQLLLFFALLEQVSDSGRISSVLIQDEVPARYSGAVLTSSEHDAIVEGVAGFGDELMLGRQQPGGLPHDLIALVMQLHLDLNSKIGGLRAEWAFDGIDVWTLQLQPEAALSAGMTIVAGTPTHEVDFDLDEGLSGLKELVSIVANTTAGIRIRGGVGMTSHIADLLRRHRIPSRVVAIT